MCVSYRLKAILACVFFSICVCMASAQVKKSARKRRTVDSTAIDLNSRISDSILNEKEIRDTTVPNMVNKVETYSFSLNRAENFFEKRLDTAGMLKSLSRMERALNYFHNKLERNDNPLNLRSLNTASVLLGESRETMSGWQKSLDFYIDQLNGIHQRIRTVKHDSTLLNDSLNQILHGEMKAVYDRSLSLD